MADNELTAILNRRNKINEGEIDCPTEGVVVKGSQPNEGEKSTTDAASNELAKKLNNRAALNDGEAAPQNPSSKIFNPYTEFKEFSRSQIKEFEKMFKKYDIDRDHFINLTELKYMMEKLEAPQTHLSLKTMIKEVDEDCDDQISFREFLLIFRKAALGELEVDGLIQLANLSEIDVTAEGVSGAKNFFEAKVNQIAAGDKFEKEIKQEQEERRQQMIEKKQKQDAFRAKAALFK